MFTVVFEGDISDLPANPFKTDTAFGRPTAAATGDRLVATDQLDEACEWLRACLGLVEGGGAPNWDGIREFLKSTTRGSD